MKKYIILVGISIIFAALFLNVLNQLSSIVLAEDPIYNYNFQDWTNGFVYNGEESPCNFREGDKACTGGDQSPFFGVSTAECKIITPISYYKECNYGIEPTGTCNISNEEACDCREVETPGCGKVLRLFKKIPCSDQEKRDGICEFKCSEKPEPVSCEQCCQGKSYKWNPRTGGCICAVKKDEGSGSGNPPQPQCHTPSPQDMQQARQHCEQQGKQLVPRTLSDGCTYYYCECPKAPPKPKCAENEQLVPIYNKTTTQGSGTTQGSETNEKKLQGSGQCIIDYKCELKTTKSVLRQGWNFISTSSGRSWNDIKGTCELVQNTIYRFDPGDTKNPWVKITTSENLHPFVGYLIYVNKACYISDTAYNKSEALTLAIKKGYNLVSVEATKAFANILNDCSIKNNFLAQYTASQSNPYKFIDIKQNINPLVGYFAYFEKDCTLKFEVSGGSIDNNLTLPPAPSF